MDGWNVSKKVGVLDPSAKQLPSWKIHQYPEIPTNPKVCLNLILFCVVKVGYGLPWRVLFYWLLRLIWFCQETEGCPKGQVRIIYSGGKSSQGGMSILTSIFFSMSGLHSLKLIGSHLGRRPGPKRKLI